MKIFYSEIHRAHDPAFEVFDGGKRHPYLENPDRMDRVLSALKKTDWAEFLEPVDFGLEPIQAVHDKDYLIFLASCWTDWNTSLPQVDEAPEKNVLLPATFALRRQSRRVPTTVLGKAGYYMMDLSACIVEGTYKAALSSANCALSAAQSITEHSLTAFSLARPPGHHAGRDYAAGYCFINNAAVAAHWLSSKGKVAILDIDYHVGNGTEDIFYERRDVLTISIHADPDLEYPYYLGYADEKGAGDGLGFHYNFPLPKGTDDARYLSTLDEALGIIRNFAPTYLVLPTGMDTFEHDPLGQFKLTRQGYEEIGKRIAGLNLPTVITMEGGYANEELGNNVASLLEKFK